MKDPVIFIPYNIKGKIYNINNYHINIVMIQK